MLSKAELSQGAANHCNVHAHVLQACRSRTSPGHPQLRVGHVICLRHASSDLPKKYFCMHT